jgi:hypothetical protein
MGAKFQRLVRRRVGDGGIVADIEEQIGVGDGAIPIIC